MKRICSKCKKSKPTSAFSPRITYTTIKGKRYGPYRGYASWCRVCSNEAVKARYHANSKVVNERVKGRYRERIQKAIEFLGGKCVDCGTTEKLIFDHFKVGVPVTSVILCRWSRVVQELRKCELRCGDCHLAKHGKGWKQNLPT